MALNFIKSRDLRINATDLSICWKNFDALQWIMYSAAAALPITIALSFTMRRLKRNLDCCDGRPGVAYPWDTLVYAKGRLQTVLTMVLICYPAYLLISSNTAIFDIVPLEAGWLKTPLKLGSILLVGLSLHPIFLSASKPSILTRLVALLMTAYQCVVVTLPLAMCVKDLELKDYYVELMLEFPTLLAGSVLIGLLAYKLIRSILKRRRLFPEEEVGKSRSFLKNKEKYVKNLLGRRKLLILGALQADNQSVNGGKGSSKIGTLLQSLRKKLTYNKVDGFYYPVSVMCSFAASFVLLYYMAVQSTTMILNVQLATQEFWFESYNKNDTRTIHEVFAECVSNNRLNWTAILEEDDNFLRIMQYVLDNFVSILVAAIVLAAFNGAAVLVLMFINYRDNVLRAYAGNYEFVIKRSEFRPSGSISGFCRYGGYQVGYTAWAMLLQFVMYTLVICIIWYSIIMPLVFNYDLWFVGLISRIWPTLIIALLIGQAQSLVPRFCFVVDGGSKLAIRRRTIFLVWNYYSYIISTVMGLLSCLLRLIKAFVIAFVFLARLDWCSLPPRFRFLDGGHLAYAGQLHTDAVHSHPVVIMFIETLKRSARKRKEFESANLTNSSSLSLKLNEDENSRTVDNHAADSPRKQAAAEGLKTMEELDSFHRGKRFKWLVAYTLLNNPTLVQDRKSLSIAQKNKAALEELKKARKLRDSTAASQPAAVLRAEESNF